MSARMIVALTFCGIVSLTVMGFIPAGLWPALLVIVAAPFGVRNAARYVLARREAREFRKLISEWSDRD